MKSEHGRAEARALAFTSRLAKQKSKPKQQMQGLKE